MLLIHHPSIQVNLLDTLLHPSFIYQYTKRSPSTLFSTFEHTFFIHILSESQIHIPVHQIYDDFHVSVCCNFSSYAFTYPDSLQFGI